MSEEEEREKAPPCPDCGCEMILAWLVPKMAHLPEVRTFRCADCQGLFTNDGDPSEPLTKLRIW
jgi:hypothetical protein